ncbi:hypothetical protein [Azonexus hydrophilus]|uniref:Uncharacterized protein n=1 Tax=Azonexus hydrophilus TaxID=418702 RepID=A0ABZ2XN86_9RHOO
MNQSIQDILVRMLEQVLPATHRVVQDSPFASVVVLPVHATDSMNMVCFEHCPAVPGIAGETINATAIIVDSCKWQLNREFGEHAALIEKVLCGEVANAALSLISRVMADPVFAPFEWRTCAHDRLKKEMFCHGKKVSSIWKFKSTWGTCHGNIVKTLAAAKRQTEEVQRGIIATSVAEKLSRLTSSEKVWS